jgi:D-sedoheptulose 7-phosphate isomerase
LDFAGEAPRDIRGQLAAHEELFSALHQEPYPELVAKLSERIVEAYRAGNKLVLMGNGGSAADAQHVAAEMVARFKLERPAWPALALHANTSTITAIGNDYGYDDIYVRQVEAFVAKDDVVIGISTSGNSENVVRALEKAKERGAWTVAFTGQGGGRAAKVVDLLLAMPSRDTPRVQEAHITLLHIMCDLVERALVDG